MPNLLLTMWDTIKSSNIGILVAAGLGMFAIIGGLSMLSYRPAQPHPLGRQQSADAHQPLYGHRQKTTG